MPTTGDTPRHPTRTDVAVTNLIVDDRDCVLLVRETKPSALGRWSFPGGGLEGGETIREGAAREALEETGLVVAPGPLLGIYHAPLTVEGAAAVQFVFLSEITGGEVVTSHEHPEVEFFSRAQVSDLAALSLLRGQHLLGAIADFDAGVRWPDDLITTVLPSTPPTRARTQK